MKIDRNLDWEPSFGNQIDVEIGGFTITITKKEVEIEYSWDDGHLNRGTETMSISLEQLENLIKELKNS